MEKTVQVKITASIMVPNWMVDMPEVLQKHIELGLKRKDLKAALSSVGIEWEVLDVQVES